MAGQPNPDPFDGALATLRELRDTVGGLYDRLIEANNQISRLDQENILLRFEIERHEAEVRALRLLNPAPLVGAEVRVQAVNPAPPNEPEDPQNEPAPTSDEWTAPSGGARRA